ncbi:ATP-binding cassette domain-containing protein [Paludibacterium paludis]|uniref:ABC transporter domain-containing protein n=1 Tax=Paludibacterium paludis TaxID=1225769 RepID=A0A918P581_9NEIS|nr:ATP-binding cassette domain-containing protein [Paludibacterium paludis]GGY24760.1 hypothetical protein GCM10011289_30480 [Paludibacterium paludis]
MEAIEVRQLRFAHGDHVLFDNCSVTLRAGRLYGLIGPNGAGKTTFFNLLRGDERPQGGGIESGIAPHRIGMLVQDYAAFSKLRVSEAFDFIGLINREAGAPGWHALLDNLAVDNRERAARLALKPLWTLSTGERRWLYLEWLLKLPGLDCLLLDEPTAGVDPEYRLLIGQRIRDALTVQRLIVISSHLLDELGGLCDEILLIRDRRIEGFAGLDAFACAFNAASADAAFVSAIRTPAS